MPKENFWILRIGLARSLSSLQKSELLKLNISFLHYFWCQNWDQWHKISFGYVDFYAKSFLILYPFLENSTTPIAIIWVVVRAQTNKCFVILAGFLARQDSLQKFKLLILNCGIIILEILPKLKTFNQSKWAVKNFVPKLWPKKQ